MRAGSLVPDLSGFEPPLPSLAWPYRFSLKEQPLGSAMALGYPGAHPSLVGTKLEPMAWLDAATTSCQGPLSRSHTQSFSCAIHRRDEHHLQMGSLGWVSQEKVKRRGGF